LAILTAVGGASDDNFGNSVAIDRDIIVVGSSGETSGTGAVYVYKINENASGNISSISQVVKLTASGGKTDDAFGYSVAIRGNFILVGAYGVEKGGVLEAGAAYLFGYISKDSNLPQWTQLAKFQPSDLISDAYFGYSVAMDNNIAVIGAFNGISAYVFVPLDPSSPLSSSWNQIAKLTGPMDSWFGYSVAVAGSRIVVGAYGDDTKATDAGAVFVFSKKNSVVIIAMDTNESFISR
jgi:hypothetical protein